jgi:hypothetical protein
MLALLLKLIFTIDRQTLLVGFSGMYQPDGFLSSCTLAQVSISKFSDEGQYCVNIRGIVWLVAQEILTDTVVGFHPTENRLFVAAHPREQYELRIHSSSGYNCSR